MPGSPMNPTFWAIFRASFCRAWLLPAFFLLTGMVISGCESMRVHLSGVSSMRVQVDVYKGPLADELPTQWASLSEVGNDFSFRLQHYNNDIGKDITNDDYCPQNILDDLIKFHTLLTLLKSMEPDKAKERMQKQDYKEGKEALSNLSLDCSIMIALWRDSHDLREASRKQYTVKNALDLNNELQGTISKNELIKNELIEDVTLENEKQIEKYVALSHDLKKALRNFEKIPDFTYYDEACLKAEKDSTYQEFCSQAGKHLFVSAKARISAHYWSVLSGIHYPNERKVRQQMANYANLTAQFSQELRYRADIILKQLNGLTEKNAPLALKLRNTSLNEFLNLYVWYRAADLPIMDELPSEGPFYIFSSEQTRDRVRAMELLYDYESWENINEVHANGRGEFSLALIKDRIGNWRLKSYESDPSELLGAYTKVGTTLLDSAAKLAGRPGVASNPLSLQNIQDMTNTATRMATVTELSSTQLSSVQGQEGLQDTKLPTNTSPTGQSGTETTSQVLFAAQNSRKNTHQSLGSFLHSFSNNPAVTVYRDLQKWEEVEKTLPEICFDEGKFNKEFNVDASNAEILKCVAALPIYQETEAEKFGPRPTENAPQNTKRTEILTQYKAQLNQLFMRSQDRFQAHAETIEALKP